MGQLYQTQRAMRHMRKAAMQRGVIAILDVGTSKIACLVLRFDGTAYPSNPTVPPAMNWPVAAWPSSIST